MQLRELALLSSLRIVDTSPNASWRFTVDKTVNQYGVAVAYVLRPDGDVASGHAVHALDWIEEAIWLNGVGSRTDQETLALAEQVVYLKAHESYRDIFITTHTVLLEKRSRAPHANIRTLSEGLRILGLYLRTLGPIPIRVSLINDSSAQATLGLDLFYWVLCRQRLPAMWRYFSACLKRGKSAQDKTEYLGNTILDRCVRALQARDEIGSRFYQSQNNTTRDGMLYHFDYLTILLSGALDAQAVIAARTYDIEDFSPAQTNFRSQRFRHAIASAQRSTPLADLLETERFLDFQKFLGALRNTIHSIGLRGMGVSRGGHAQASLVNVHEGDRVVWETSCRLGLREDLGVTTAAGVAIEPYTCASRLTELGFYYVNEIAKATDVERLLPPKEGLEERECLPPAQRGVWDEETRGRVDALG